MSKVFITGPARSGTSLLLILSKYFNNCFPHLDEEKHPLAPCMWHESSQYKHTIIKQPYGFFEEFRPAYSFQDLFNAGWKIICLIRDPRDTLVSYNKREKNGAHWCPPKSWIRTARELIDNVGHPCLFALHYEDLVKDPVPTMNEVAQFLDVSLDQNFLNFYKDSPILENKWKTLNGFRPIDQNSIGAWKDEKHAEYLDRVITEEIRELALKLGYEL